MLVLVLSLLGACNEEVNCTMEAVYAVNIQLEDQEGSPINDAEITYTVDGIESTDIFNSEDGSYALGIEQSGEFEISISVSIPFENDPCCWDSGQANISVEIEEDQCHVIPQLLEPELEWASICADSTEGEECG